MQAYIAVSFNNRPAMENEIQILCEVLLSFNINPFVFVDHYHFTVQQEKEMMVEAFKKIDESDLFIAELTHKAIGVGIEAGYAAAKNKPLIYVRQFDADHSTTIAGISSQQIFYKAGDDLKSSLIKYLETAVKLT
jgi:nucleoside 2-deoxyribosyltransferase